MTLELMTVPVISTAHLTQATGVKLTQDGDTNLWTVCAPYEHGWFLYMQSDLTALDSDTPPDLLDLFKWAKTDGRNFDYVRLDCDAGAVEGLPLYNW